MVKEKLLKKIKTLKSEPFGKIIIDCNFEKLKYQLLLISKDCIMNKKIIRLLFLWRKKHEFWFQSQFKITFMGTQKWLEDRVINTPDRLLFMIKVKDRYIGHIGLFRFDFKKNTCEIDNVIRGVSLYSGIMSNALTHLMKWGKSELLLNNYTLETSSDNQKAIKLYTQLGFIETQRVPLIKSDINGYNEWIVAPKNYTKKIERYQCYMKMIKN